MKPVDNWSAFGAAVERERIFDLLVGADASDSAAIKERLDAMTAWMIEEGANYDEVFDELNAINDAIDVISKPKLDKFTGYQMGWYQDVDGNLYKYDGVVWDVVPRKEAGELEFLG